MAIFTKIEDLFSQFNQSVGGHPTEGGNGNDSNRIFQPDRGLDVLIYNTSYINRDETDFTTGVSASFDNRQTLGTITLNDRDYWENINFSENTFQPYLTGNRKVVNGQSVIEDGNGDHIITNIQRETSPTYRFSIDAIPFVINPNTDEIVRLDRYHDKEIDSKKYDLTTEGKINYYILPRGDGRTEKGNIDTYVYKGLKTANNGKNRFDDYAEGTNSIRGYHLFRLDWGDGTPLEHTSRTKILESTTLLEHTYDKPGFYTIKGVVMAVDINENIGAWERFETNILVNASDDYDVNLYNDRNFVTIGGISPDSVLVKSATDLIGINPLTFDTSKASPNGIKNINLFDRLRLFDFLTKIDFNLLLPFYDLSVADYTEEIQDTTEPLFPSIVYGCLDSNANNTIEQVDGTIYYQDDSCDFSYTLSWSEVETEQNLNFTSYYIPGGLPPNNNPPDNWNTEGDFWWQGFIHGSGGENNSLYGDDQLPSSAFENPSNNPVLFIRFNVSGQPPDSMVTLANGSRSHFSLNPILVFDGSGGQGTGEIVSGWYTVTSNSEPSTTNFGDGELFFVLSNQNSMDEDPPGDFVVEANLVANAGDNFYYINANTGQPRFINPGEYVGSYHVHYSGVIHTGAGVAGEVHDVDGEPPVEIVHAIPPVDSYRIIIHNSPFSNMSGTVYSKVRFPGEGNPSHFFEYNTAIENMYNGLPEGNDYKSNDPNAEDINVANFISDDPLVLPHPPFGGDYNPVTGDTHAQSFNVQLGTEGIEVTAQGDIVQNGSINSDSVAWVGWYRDASFNNQITTNKTVTITLGDSSTYGNVEASDVDGINVIHLYAKVEPSVEM